jgi:hypothetical protein
MAKRLILFQCDFSKESSSLRLLGQHRPRAGGSFPLPGHSGGCSPTRFGRKNKSSHLAVFIWVFLYGGIAEIFPCVVYTKTLTVFIVCMLPAIQKPPLTDLHFRLFTKHLEDQACANKLRNSLEDVVASD